jgi:hypothetical protein
VDGKPLLKPLIAALQDRTPEVRRLAEEALMELTVRVEFDLIKTACKDVRPAVKMQLEPVLKRLAAAASAPQKQQRLPATKPLAEESRGRSAAPTTTSARQKSKSPPRRSGTTQASAVPSAIRPPAAAAKPPVARAPMPQSAFIANEGKERREMEDTNVSEKGRGWSFQKRPGSEHVQHLREQMRGCVSEELHSKLFSNDFRKLREVIDDLIGYVEEFQELETWQNADVLLKWCTLRLHDDNATTRSKALSLVQRIFDILDSTERHLSDYEARVILPVLIERMGAGEELVENIRTALQTVPRIYPSSKFCEILLRYGLELSPSPRTRAECLELVAYLIRRQGLNACSEPTRALPLILRFLSDSTAGVRNSTLKVMKQAHLHVGDELWAYLGPVSDAQRTLLTQKFANDSPIRPATVQKIQHAGTSSLKLPGATGKGASAVPASPRRSSDGASSKPLDGSKKMVPAVSRQAVAPPTKLRAAPEVKSSAKEAKFDLELEKLEVPQAIATSKAPEPLVRTISLPSLAAPTPCLPSRLRGSITNEVTAESWIHELETGDSNSVIEICDRLIDKLRNPQVVTAMSAASTTDELVQGLSTRLRTCFTQREDATKARERRYLVNAMCHIFQCTAIARSLGIEAAKATLMALMSGLACPFLRPKPSEQPGEVFQGLRLAMKRALDGIEPSVLLCALMQLVPTLLLATTEFNLMLADSAAQGLGSALNGIEQAVDTINIDQFLRDANSLLASLALCIDEDTDRNRLRESCEQLVEMALRKLLRLKGRSELVRHCNLLPSIDHYPPPPLIAMLNNISANLCGAPAFPTQVEKRDVEDEQDKDESRIATKLALKAIFQKMAGQDRQEALRELYIFKTKNPNVDIQPLLNSTTPQFQAYVRRGLMNMEEKENEPRSDNIPTKQEGTSVQSGTGYQ